MQRLHLHTMALMNMISWEWLVGNILLVRWLAKVTLWMFFFVLFTLFEQFEHWTKRSKRTKPTPWNGTNVFGGPINLTCFFVVVAVMMIPIHTVKRTHLGLRNKFRNHIDRYGRWALLIGHKWADAPAGIALLYPNKNRLIRWEDIIIFA